MSSVPPRTFSWAEDNDDGAFDVNDSAALKVRLVEASNASVPTPPVLRADLILRSSRPLPSETGLSANRQVNLVSRSRRPNDEVDRQNPRSTTSQATSNHPVEEANTKKRVAPSFDVNARGVPLLAPGDAPVSRGHVSSEVWNTLAANVSALAAPSAKAVFEHIQNSQGAVDGTPLTRSEKKRRRK
jgi:hypothetical protein